MRAKKVSNLLATRAALQQLMMELNSCCSSENGGVAILFPISSDIFGHKL